MPIDQTPLQGDQIGPALYAVAAALVATGGFVGFIVRWMMTRIDAGQLSMTEALGLLRTTVATLEKRDEDASRHREALARVQEEILEQLRENGRKA